MSHLVTEDLAWISPFLILAITGMLLVLAEAFFKGRDHTTLVGLTVAGSVAATIASVILYRQLGPNEMHPIFADAKSGAMLVGDRFGYVLTGLFSMTTAFVALMSPAHQREHGWQNGEYYGIMMLAASGMAILAIAASLVTVFLGIETMSIGVYVMCALRRTSRRSNEAAMKYFIVGAFATGFLMYGMALLYGASGTLSLLNMQAALAKTVNPGLVVAGGFLLIVAFGFKVAAVPFHMWAPDAYEGAPTPVTAFMAAAVKSAAIAAMIRVFGARTRWRRAALRHARLGEPDGRDRRDHDHDRQYLGGAPRQHQAHARVLVDLARRRAARRTMRARPRLADGAELDRLLLDRVLGRDDRRVRRGVIRRLEAPRAAPGR